MIRHGAVLEFLLGSDEKSVEPGLRRMLALLVLARCISPGSAAAQLPGQDFSPLWRAPDELARRAARIQPVHAMAVGGSLPSWVARQWLGVLGGEAPRFLAALVSRPRVAIRVNRNFGDRDCLARRLSSEGLGTRPSNLSPDCLLVDGHPDLHLLSSFREGFFEIQDEGSQMVAQLWERGPGSRVLDFCAGAGGKSLAMAASGARVWALDVRPAALRTLTRRAHRARLSIRTDILSPGGLVPVPPDWADTVLVDAPCSGSGVLRRHPEYRFALGREAVHSMQRRQREILRRALEVLRPGGHLVYATCSLLRQENQGQVEWLLAEYPDLSRCGALGNPGDDGLLWPHRTGTDGFFAVILRRRG